ncbi:hypothetical protein DWY69_03985 [Eisenbergiella massiliensis]|uniref:Uncharacterized protein n=1 Tax=Eisenbergiella massiliensis TaxID=1720294 RepID=A0A3E3J1Y6_9FIRM|nr:hypothetical protein DWY69_03985 [Eisenbergiella massiliensis]
MQEAEYQSLRQIARGKAEAADKPFGEEAAEENFLGEPGLDDSEKKSGGKCAPPHSGVGALYCCPGRQQVRDPPKL